MRLNPENPEHAAIIAEFHRQEERGELKPVPDDWEDQTFAEQQAVMDSYRQCGAVQSKADEEALHMFFSPHCVPRGMTYEQARTCIEHYALRKQQHAVRDQKAKIDQRVRRIGAIEWCYTRFCKLFRREIDDEYIERLDTAKLVVQMERVHPVILPDELICPDITPERFDLGMKKFLDEVKAGTGRVVRI